jgi:hypothetical protein
MQLAQDLREPRKYLCDITRLLIFRIRFVGDLDIEIEAGFVLLA